MRLMSLKQYMKMSKPALIRKITKALRAMPKVKLARLCYNITKAKLPRLSTTHKRLAQKDKKIEEVEKMERKKKKEKTEEVYKERKDR